MSVSTACGRLVCQKTGRSQRYHLTHGDPFREPRVQWTPNHLPARPVVSTHSMLLRSRHGDRHPCPLENRPRREWRDRRSTARGRWGIGERKAWEPRRETYSRRDAWNTQGRTRVDRARGVLRELLGKEVALYPTADGMDRYLTAEVCGDYTGLLRLTTEQKILVEGTRSNRG